MRDLLVIAGIVLFVAAAVPFIFFLEAWLDRKERRRLKALYHLTHCHCGRPLPCFGGCR